MDSMTPVFEFRKDEDGSLTLENVVFQALGAASVCWSEMPKGIFDSTRVKEIGHKLIKAITEGELDNIEVSNYAPD